MIFEREEGYVQGNWRTSFAAKDTCATKCNHTKEEEERRKANEQYLASPAAA